MDKPILDAMLPYFSRIYANPSSLHRDGRLARDAIEQARKTIAAFLGTEPPDIIFTSGALESCNLAIQGFAFANKAKGDHIAAVAEEPSSILGPCKFLEKSGFNVTYLNSYDDLGGAIRDSTILVAMSDLMWPPEKIVQLAKKRNVPFFLDACNKFGKVAIDVNNLRIDLLSCDSAAVGGPPGVGALYIRKGVKLTPLIVGGHHERGLRAGTENVAGIVGFAKAIEQAARCL